MEHQVPECVIWGIPKPPKDHEADHQQEQGCLFGSVTSGTWDGWMQAGIRHLWASRNPHLCFWSSPALHRLRSRLVTSPGLPSLDSRLCPQATLGDTSRRCPGCIGIAFHSTSLGLSYIPLYCKQNPCLHAPREPTVVIKKKMTTQDLDLKVSYVNLPTQGCSPVEYQGSTAAFLTLPSVS